MKQRKKAIWRLGFLGAAAVLAAGLIAPWLSVGSFGNRITRSLERALGRRIEHGSVHLNLFTGPGFSIDQVIIHDETAAGAEPFAYVERLDARVSFRSLWRGRLEFSNLRLVNPSVNLVRPEGARWNFEPLLTRTAGAAPRAGAHLPEIQVRGGRINFKLGDTKSIFYLMETELDALPPSSPSGEWRLRLEGQPARSDRPAYGFGVFSARGRWWPDPRTGGRIEMFLDLEKSSLAELIQLLHGHDIGVHGQIGSRARLTGPVSNLEVAGEMRVGDIHRWDMLPPYGEVWRLDYRGRLDLVSQTLELETVPQRGAAAPPVSFRLRASGYLTRPRWALIATLRNVPLAPFPELARHMGLGVPPALVLAGDISGVLGYSPGRGIQGKVACESARAEMPDSPPVTLDRAEVLVDGERISLAPTVFRSARKQQATIEASFAWRTQDLEARISADAMSIVEPGASSGALFASVPFLEQFRKGSWSGELRYTKKASEPGSWAGGLAVHSAQVTLAGIADPLKVASARVVLGGAAVAMDRIVAGLGAAEIQGEYRYKPGAARPHQFRVSVAALDAGELERLLMPALRRDESFLARALRLGRARVPDWLESRHADGRLDIGSLTLAGVRLERVRARVRWDAENIDVNGISARFGGDVLQGRVTANLRRAAPAYGMNAQFRALHWMGGQWDGKTLLETSGIGPDLLRNLRLEGSFQGRSISPVAGTEFKNVSGSYVFTVVKGLPHFQFSQLRARVGEDTFEGQGATGADGRLYFELSDGQKPMRLSGALSPFQLDLVAVKRSE